MNDTTLGVPQRLAGSHPQWWLGALLLALHLALAWGIDGWPARAFLLAHFGLFLMWQPVWRGERNLDTRQALLVVIAAVALAIWNDWWLMAVWLAVLFALIGGNFWGNQQPRQRLAAILAALYLLALLLIWVVPHLFAERDLGRPLVLLVQYGLIWLPVLIAVIPSAVASSSPPRVVDLFYSTMLFLLVTGLVLGSFVVKEVSHGDYPLALAQTLIVMALLLVILSWLWNPHSGFVGIGQMLSRYLMTLGLPFEHWVKGLADHAEREREPERFLAVALRDMCELPWVAGVAWQTPHGGGELGARSRFEAEFAFRDLRLAFHTRWSLSPALLLHLKLLTQMVGHFYEAKQREELQRQSAYTQAIYETGARLTHDVKNLLQSLRSLCAAAESSGAEQAGALQELIKRQLPLIAQRLTATLEKLKAPQPANPVQVDAAVWWEGLKQRYTRNEIAFSANGALAAVTLPGELFDSVAENLLQNATAKAQLDASVSISVSLQSDNGGGLRVCDSGKAVPPAIAERLFSAPVPSQTGFGIGLFQAAKQAQQLGYNLTLESNSKGKVCFVLARA